MSDNDFAFNLFSILEQVGFDEKKRKRIKLVRHPLNNKRIKEIYERGFIEVYQCEQNSEIFKGCDYILSFLGEGGSSARFIGCYKVGEFCSGAEMLAKMPKDYPDEESFHSGVYYDLQKTDILKSLQNRLVIAWNNPIAWHQWCSKDIPILSIYPKNRFPGYESVTLSYQELKEIIEEESADWVNPLSKVGGIYLITTPDGLYVGSAYGKEGIWNRWSDYVKTKHGGNKELIDLINRKPGIYKEFRYSILKVVPKRSVDEDVIAWENYFKDILKTRKTPWGLNGN